MIFLAPMEALPSPFFLEALALRPISYYPYLLLALPGLYAGAPWPCIKKRGPD